jgi:hypothetical protein
MNRKHSRNVLLPVPVSLQLPAASLPAKDQKPGEQ